MINIRVKSAFSRQTLQLMSYVEKYDFIKIITTMIVRRVQYNR